MSKPRRRHRRGGPKPNQTVTISVVNGQTTVDVDSVHISNSGENEVIWQSDGNEPFAVTFPSGSPFASVLFMGKKGKPAHSARSMTLLERDFEYTVQVLGAAALDPVVHTDP